MNPEVKQGAYRDILGIRPPVIIGLTCIQPVRSLVVLSDVAEGLFEDVVVANLELDVEGLPKRLAHLLVAADRGLPPLEADPTDDLVDPVDDVLDDDRGLIALESVK